MEEILGDSVEPATYAVARWISRWAERRVPALHQKQL